MKIVFGDLSAEVGRENIFKPTLRNGSLHEISNDYGVKLVKFAISKNLIVKSTMLPHKNIHKYTWTSPDGKTLNNIDHIFIDKRWHSNIVEVQSSRAVVFKLFSPRTPRDTFPLNFVPPKLLVHNSSYT